MDPDPSSFLSIIAVLNAAAFFKLIVLLLLLLCSALISGAEVAFFSLSQTELNEWVNSKRPRGNMVANLLEEPKRLLATILIANNFVNISIVLLISSMSELLFGRIDLTLWSWLDLRFLVEVGVTTFLILLFGEILPKIYASRNRQQFAGLMALPLNVLDKLCSPLSLPMQFVTSFLQDRLGKKRTNFSVDQLSHALELASEEDTTKEEKKILQGIVNFGNTETRQIMKPRLDIFALSEEAKYADVLQEIIRNGYSRVPVYKDNIDHVTGVLYVKDLLPHLDRKTMDWSALKRPPYFIPENKKLDDLLQDFQEMKNHLAIVVDEYGGTSGLITLEDIIEEIVGDISDEFDVEDLVYSKLDDKNFVFDGKTTLREFYRAIRLADETLFEERKGDSETIAGFVLEIAGSFPKKGERIQFQQYVFEVEALDKKRIKQIKVTLP